MGLVRISEVKRGFPAKDGLCTDSDIMVHVAQPQNGENMVWKEQKAQDAGPYKL